MCCGTTEGNLTVSDRKKNMLTKVLAAAKRGFLVLNLILANTMTAYATVNIDTNFNVSPSIGNMNPEGLIIGIGVWVARLIGIGMLIWGIYGYFTARKDGEAESMNAALGKLTSGIALILMPNILRGLKIIS